MNEKQKKAVEAFKNITSIPANSILCLKIDIENCQKTNDLFFFDLEQKTKKNLPAMLELVVYNSISISNDDLKNICQEIKEKINEKFKEQNFDLLKDIVYLFMNFSKNTMGYILINKNNTFIILHDFLIF